MFIAAQEVNEIHRQNKHIISVEKNMKEITKEEIAKEKNNDFRIHHPYPPKSILIPLTQLDL
jgi:hypothetical protein